MNPTCPHCESTDTMSVDCYDFECNDCGLVFTVEDGNFGNDEDYGKDR
jgi:transposase-like protein